MRPGASEQVPGEVRFNFAPEGRNANREPAGKRDQRLIAAVFHHRRGLRQVPSWQL
ncbi:hypothetical protein D3C78_1099670 [compost metagenome]